MMQNGGKKGLRDRGCNGTCSHTNAVSYLPLLLLCFSIAFAFCFALTSTKSEKWKMENGNSGHKLCWSPAIHIAFPAEESPHC